MRRVLRICGAAFLVMTLLLAGGCSKSSNSNNNDTPVFAEPQYEWGKIVGRTITVWGDRDDLARNYVVKAFSRYEEMTGNVIETVALTKQDIDQTVPFAFHTEGAERPDLLLSYGGANIMNLNPAENFYDFTNAQWIDDLTDVALTQSIVNGKVMGLPWGEASISGFLYQKEIFKKYKISMPKTQAEFMEVCQKLLAKGVTPVYLPYAEITMLLYQFPMDSLVQDTKVLEALNNGELTYAKMPEMHTIVQWYKDMADRGYFGENYQLNDWNGMDNAMKNGKYAMMPCWDTWLYTNFTGDPSSIGLMPAFMGVPKNGCFEGPNVSLMLVNKKSENMDVALDLITFLADPYNYNVAYEGIYTAPVFNNQIGSVTTPQYVEAERLIDKYFYNSTAWLRIKGFSQIDASFIQKCMQNELTQKECLQAMDEARIKRAEGRYEKGIGETKQ